MKARRKRGGEGNNHVSREEQVRSEIQSFLKAIDSYPERFSREPKISFEQHRRSIGRAAERSGVRPQDDPKRTARPA